MSETVPIWFDAECARRPDLLNVTSLASMLEKTAMSFQGLESLQSLHVGEGIRNVKQMKDTWRVRISERTLALTYPQECL